MKTCKKCNAQKNFSEYHKDSRSKDGLSARCKECRCSASRDWYADNKERSKETNRVWRSNNPDWARNWWKSNSEKLKEYNASNYEKHREKYLAQKKEHYANNVEEMRARSVNWGRANLEKKRHANQRRRALKNNAVTDPSVTVESLREIHGDQCAYCGVTMDFSDHTLPNYRNLEHVLPLVLGGSHTFDNCLLIDKVCNSKKGPKHPDEWFALLEKERTQSLGLIG